MEMSADLFPRRIHLEAVMYVGDEENARNLRREDEKYPRSMVFIEKKNALNIC